jgi:hypothetical protein
VACNYGLVACDIREMKVKTGDARVADSENSVTLLFGHKSGIFNVYGGLSVSFSAAIICAYKNLKFLILSSLLSEAQ